MDSQETIFPDRPIRIKKTGVWPGIFQYLGALLLLGVAGFIGTWQGPGIINDWLVSQDPIMVEDAVITDGECSTSRGVFVDCSAHVAYAVGAQQIDRNIELMFIDFGSSDYMVDVVRSSSEPERVTLSLGLDMLWNRTLTGLAFVGGIAAAGIALFAAGLRSDRNRRLARQPSILQPLPVLVTIISKVVGGKVVQYQYGQNAKQRPLLTTSRFAKSEAPLWLENEGTYALAVMPQNAKLPVLLDSELTRLDLTDTERATAKANIARLYSVPPAIVA